jgi:CheY-like chemotaxis protein
VKVLVVDDEQDVAVLFGQMFRREVRSGQMHLDFAFSGEEALSYLAEHRADVVLVLSDINMPGMNGLELLKQIKSTPPPLPVCMMTAYGSEEYRSKADSFGCDGYLTKPIDFPALKQQIASYLAAA